MKTKLRNAAIFLIAVLMAAASLAGCNKDSQPATPAEPLPKLELDAAEHTLTVGESFTLTATLENSAAEIRWSVDDEEVASVSNGTVTAYAAGVANVTASAGALTAVCKVTVSNVQIPTLKAGITSTVVYKGQTRVIQNVAVYENGKPAAQQPVFTYASENSEIATVDADGVICGVAVGNTVVTVSASYGDYELKRTFAITVEELTMIAMQPSVTVSYMPKCYDGDVPDAVQMQVTGYVDGAELTDPTEITWSVDKTDVINVSESGVLTALKEGTATLTASHGTVSEKCTVTVVPQEREIVLQDFTDSPDFNAWPDSSNPSATCYNNFVNETLGDKTGTFYKFTQGMTADRAQSVGSMNFQVDYGKRNLRQLYEQGYNRVIIPMYLKYISVREDGKDLSGKDMKGYMRLRMGSIQSQEIVPGNGWTDRYKIYRDKWTNVVMDMGELIALQAGQNNCHKIFTVLLWHTEDTDTQAFELYVGNITAIRTADTVFDTTVDNSWHASNSPLNCYGNGSWGVNIGYGKISDSDTQSYMYYTVGDGAFMGYRFSGNLEKSTTVNQLLSLKRQGFDTLRFPVYTSKSGVTFEDHLAPDSADGDSFVVPSAGSDSKKSMSVWQNYKNGIYANQSALAQNAWTNIDMPLDYVIARLTKNDYTEDWGFADRFFAWDFSGLSAGDSIYIGKITAVKKVA
mgnify:CR=1 FL=1